MQNQIQMMNKQLIAIALFVVLLLQGCASMTLIDIPEPGTRRSACMGKCTVADRNFAIFQNATIWLMAGVVGKYAVESLSDE